MDISLFLAKVLGLYLIIISVAMMINAKTYTRVLNEMINNQSLMFFGGVIALILGLVLVVSHNIWLSCWQIVITLVSWMILAKGVIIVLFPQFSIRMNNKFMKTKYAFEVTIPIAFMVGAYLCVMGFIY